MSRPKSSTLIHSAFVVVALDYVRRSGGDAAALVRRFSLPEPTGAPPGIDVSTETLSKFGQAVEEALGDPFFGLRMAESLPRGAFGVFEFAARSAPNLEAALQRLVRYSVTVTPRSIFVLEAQPKGSLLSFRIPGDPLAPGRHGTEFTLALVVYICRQLIGDDWSPRRVSFANPAPRDRDALARFFGAGVMEFDRPESSIWFDAEALQRPLASADPALLPVLERYAQTLLPSPASSSPLLDQIRHYLRGNLSGGAPSIDAAAEALHLSPRTLQRRLSALNTSYAAVLEELRRHLAQLYLDDPKLSLGEVAFLMGYSDLRAFLRAFKGWTGMTPGQVRAHAQFAGAAAGSGTAGR